MKLRFFNTFPTVSPMYEQLLPYLSESGHAVEAVIGNRPYRPASITDSSDWFRTKRVPVCFRPEWRSRAGKLALYSSYAALAGGLSLFGPRVDCNVFFTQPPLFPAWGVILRLLRRQRYVQIVMDLYPWVAIEASALRRTGTPARAAKAVARTALRRAERVVVIGRCMRRRLVEMGIEAERMRLITNWADTDAIRPIARSDNPLRRMYGIEDRFVVMYSGNLGRVHRFDDLLEVASRLRKRTEVLFLVVGAGARLSEVQSAVERRALANVRFLTYQPRERLAESLGMGDVHFVSLRNGFEGLVVPSKAYGVLAAGRPLIYQGARTGEIARMVEEENVGCVVAEGDCAGLEAAIVQALEDDAWRRTTGQRARRVGELRYGPEPGLRAFTALFEELTLQ